MSAIRLLIFLLFAGLVASCGQLPELNQKLSEIDSLTWTDPDSAYSAICQFDKSNMKNGRDSAMYRLLWAELRDKTYHDDTATNEISKAVLYFKLNDDCYNAMRALYYQGIIAYNAGLYGQALVALMEAQSQAQDCNLTNTYYPAKILGALSAVYNILGDEPKEELYARKSYEEYCKLDSAIFIIQSKLWWATTLCQTGDPKKGAKVARDIYMLSERDGDSENAVEALQIMANAALRTEEFNNAKAYYNHLIRAYGYRMTHDDLNMLMWAMTETDTPKDSIEMVYGQILELSGEEDVTYEYYVHRGDYERATLSLENELKTVEDKFGMRLKNDAGVALTNWHNNKIMESDLRLKAMKERTLWIIVVSFICVILCIVLWIYNRIKANSKINRLLKDIVILQEEGKRMIQRESDLNGKLNSYITQIDDYRAKINLMNVSPLRSNALDLWFTKINDLYTQYYLTGTSDKNKKNLFAAIEREMEYLRSDDKILAEMEQHINANNDNILSELYGTLRRITSGQRRLVALLYFGLSTEAICAILNLTPGSFYNRKSRLSAHLNKSSLVSKDAILVKIFSK